jgi:hypothetical protein
MTLESPLVQGSLAQVVCLGHRETSTECAFPENLLYQHSHRRGAVLLCFLSCLTTRPLCYNALFDAMDDLAPQSTLGH